MKVSAVLVLLAVTGVVFASAADVSPNPGTPYGSDADLTQLDYFDLEALGTSQYCVGIGYDGTNFWVTDAQDVGGAGFNQIWIITGTSPHTVVTNVDQNSTSSWGLRDMCWDNVYMYASQSTAVDYYDSSYEKVGSYTCSAVNPNRAQAWDGTYFYTGSFSETVYQVTWDGVSGSTASYTTWSTAVANGGIYGAAWDYTNDCLWVSTASADGMLYQIDPAGTLIASYNISPESATAGGCTMGDYAGSEELWVLAQDTPDGVYCWQTSTVALESDTWGSIKSMF